MKSMLVLGLIIASNCYCITTNTKELINSQQSLLPINSFIFIEKKIDVELCQSESVCFSIQTNALGSGSIVKKIDNGFFVLTANHVCDDASILPDSLKPYAKIKSKIFIRDINGKKHNSSIFKLDSKNDLCILYIGEKTNFPNLILSSRTPLIGDKIFNIAAPGGIFSANMVPIFEGFFSGKTIISNRILAVFSVYAYGGSSGSPILNHKGELIGMIHSGLSNINVMSFSPTFDILKSFLTTAFSDIESLTKS